MLGCTHAIDSDAVEIRDRTDTRDLEKLAEWLDSRWTLPGTKWRFGLDSVIGLLPGVGDAVTGLLGAYIIGRAHQLGAPGQLLRRMGLNLAIDSIFGALPLVGDVFDVAFKSNRKNVRLLLQHLEKSSRRDPVKPTARSSSRRRD